MKTKTRSKTLEFKLDPYVGALPLKIGAETSEVELLVGAADQSRIEDYKKLETRHTPGHPLHLWYSSDGKLEEIEFGKGCVLKYQDIDILNDGDVIKRLMTLDKPKIVVGIIIFLQLGISLAGFDGTGGSKTVTVFRKGMRDKYLKRMQDYNP